MGTSATLAVRHKGETGFLYASSDSHVNYVLAELTSTLTAAGIDALRAHLDLVGMTPNGEEDFQVDRRAMGNAYIQACQANGQEPFLLDRALSYEYGNPDFSHGGAISLFSPADDWNTWAANSIEDATFVLDLDRGILSVPDWERDTKPGDYDAGTVSSLWSVNLAELKGIDPEQLYLGLQNADLDDEATSEQRQAALDAILATARAGQFEKPAPWAYSGSGLDSDEDNEPAEPSIHTLRCGEDNNLALQALTVVLQDLKVEFPTLVDPDTLWFAIPREGEFELLVDLRRNTNRALDHLVGEIFQEVAPRMGMAAAAHGPHSSSGRSRHGGFASVSIGVFSEDKSAWDANVFPANHWRLRTEQQRAELLGQLKANGDGAALGDLRLVGLVALDTARWQAAEDTGLVPPLDNETLGQLAAYSLALFEGLERALPGITAKRFQDLTEGQRSAFLEGMTPVDRFVFKGLVKDAETQTARAPRP